MSADAADEALKQSQYHFNRYQNSATPDKASFYHKRAHENFDAAHQFFKTGQLNLAMDRLDKGANNAAQASYHENNSLTRGASGKGD